MNVKITNRELEMGERMVRLETDVKNINTKLDDHCSANERGFEDLSRRMDKTNTIIAQLDSSLTKRFDALWEKADNRYAGKLSEKVVYGVLGAIGLVIVYSILKKIGLEW